MIEKKRSLEVFEKTILFLMGAVIFLRFFIWRFFQNAEVLEKINLSNAVISSLILAVSLLFLTKLFIDKKSLPENVINTPFLIFLLVSGITVLYSYEKNISLRSFIVYFSFYVLFTVLMGCLTTRARIKIFIKFLVSCGFFVAVLGIIEYVKWSNLETLPDLATLSGPQKIIYYMVKNKRIGSLLGWPNVLAAFLMLNIPVSFIFCFTEKNKFEKTFFILATTSMLLAMLLTYSVTGWICFFVAVFASMLFYKKITEKQEKGISFKTLVIVTVLFFLIFGSVILGNRVKDSKISTIVPRLNYIHSVLSMINEHPFIGSGFNVYQVANRRYIFSTVEGYSMFAHNSYLQIWAETGIVGMLVFIYLILKVMRSSKESFIKFKMGEERLILAALLCSFGAFLLQNVFSFTVLKPNIAMFFWIEVALLLAWIKVVRGESKEPDQSYAVPRIKAVLMMVAVLAAMLCLVRLYKSDQDFYNGKRFLAKGDVKSAYDSFLKGEKINPLNGKIPSAMGQVYFALFKRSGNISYLEASKKKIEESISKRPLAPENFKILGYIHKIKGDPIKAKQYFDHSVSLAPYKAF